MESSPPLDRRLSQLPRLIRAHLPGPARLLEVGCGSGELALALAADGHDVAAIDPRAPDGPIFRQLRLEDLDADEPRYDAVVASSSLHHVDDAAAAVDRIADLLRPGGVILLSEFATEHLDG